MDSWTASTASYCKSSCATQTEGAQPSFHTLSLGLSESAADKKWQQGMKNPKIAKDQVPSTDLNGVDLGYVSGQAMGNGNDVPCCAYSILQLH